HRRRGPHVLSVKLYGPSGPLARSSQPPLRRPPQVTPKSLSTLSLSICHLPFAIAHPLIRAGGLGTRTDPQSPQSKFKNQNSKILRDRINALLDESATYAEIICQIQELADSPLPYPISEMDVSRWKTTGYRRYIAEQERLDSLHANREAAIAMVANDDTITLP